MSDYDYELPDERVARVPVEPRDSSRLLVLDRRSGDLRHHRFHELPDLLEPGDCLVVNETRVMRARLFAKLERTGRRIEVLLSHPWDVESAGMAQDTNPTALHSTGATHGAAIGPDRSTDASGTGIGASPAGRDASGTENGAPAAGHDASQSGIGVSPETFGDWVAILGRSRNLRAGDVLRAEDGGAFHIVTKIDRERWRIRPDRDPFAMMEEAGHLPIPPYLHREDREEDREWYQTVFASEEGAIAAPTAGLHFTKPVLDRLGERGIDIARIVLHVGPGTFLPVRAATQQEHRVLPERYSISEDAARRMANARATGHRVIAVGTTVVRALESAAHWNASSRGNETAQSADAPTTDPRTADSSTAGLPTAHLPTTDSRTADVPTADSIADLPTADLPTADLPTADLPTTDSRTANLPTADSIADQRGYPAFDRPSNSDRVAADLAGSGWTDLTIVPGHRFLAIDGLITNFHLPRSSLLLLVAAWAGRERILAAYEEAIDRGYRFYSYGDAMLIV